MRTNFRVDGGVLCKCLNCGGCFTDDRRRKDFGDAKRHGREGKG